jgi:anti-sigma factor RsiW
LAKHDARNSPRQERAEAFAALVLRYLDGLTTDDEVTALNRDLRASPACREAFVALCQMHGQLSEALAPQQVSGTGRRAKQEAADQASARPGAEPSAAPACVADSGGPAASPSPSDRPAEQGLPEPESATDTVVKKSPGEDTVHPGQGPAAAQPAGNREGAAAGSPGDSSLLLTSPEQGRGGEGTNSGKA